MKRIFALTLSLALAIGLIGCSQTSKTESDPVESISSNAVRIQLSDEVITVDGDTASTESASAVYTANDIVYYEAGHDFTYGEGEESDAHSAEEASAHTVVHITQPGTYALSGKLSAGQIAVDLGKEAKEDPSAVVTLILDGADITCSVAPAVIFYNVYECGDKDNPSKDVDTSAAGANIIIADGTVNSVTGSHVARIYKPETVELNEDGTEVAEAKKLHKYDAAFYSKVTMNVSGGGTGDGILRITADNEGLDSELHLTINGGNIHITSGNDGINTNEDGVSVTTVNGGLLTINVSGETGEGDGIDSNGWLVINGGTVIAAACSSSMDSGIDSDMGIHINGGTVLATGHMLDRIEDRSQNYAVFTFAQTQQGAQNLTLQNSKGANMLLGLKLPGNAFSNLIFSSPDLAAGDYTLRSGSTLLAHTGISAGMAGGFGGGMMPGGTMTPPEWEGKGPADMDWAPVDGQMPEGMTPPVGMDFPEGFDPSQGFGGMGAQRPEGGQRPQGGNFPAGMTPPEGMEMPEGFNGNFGGRGPGGFGGQGTQSSGELNSVFTITDGGVTFSGITAAE